MAKLKRWIIDSWKNSKLFHWLETFVNKYYQRKLTNDGFSILTSNCIGGCIYHRLGKEFLSPTINLHFSQPDFVLFCANLDWYLSQKLVFVDTQLPYPVAALPGDGGAAPEITIHFNHSKTQEEAQAKWEERKLRLNRDNLYIVCYNLDGVTVEQLKMLESVPCRNKVVLTARALPEIPWSYQIEPVMRHTYPYSYLQKNWLGVRYYERKFDFVEFLNK